MKLNFSVDIDEIFENGFEEYIHNHYYEHDTGYTEVDGEIPSIKEIVYKKAFEELVNDAKNKINISMLETTERAKKEFDERVSSELDNKVHEFSEKTMNEFLDRKVISVNKNGYSYDTTEIPLTEYLENRIDKEMFVKNFDGDGKPERYSPKFSGIDLLTNNRIATLVKNKFDELLKKQKKDVEIVLTEVIRDKLSQQYNNEETIKKIIEETLNRQEKN